jgi:hypothetical protein
VDEKEIDRLIRKLEKERSTGKGGGMRAEADRDFKKLMRATAKKTAKSKKSKKRKKAGKAKKAGKPKK